MLEKRKIVWIELLRIAACFGVIVLHTSAQHFLDIPVDGFAWKVSNFYDGISRFAVNCFVMISGCLYLDEKRSWTMKKVINAFLSIGGCLLFWQFFYAAARVVKSADMALLSVEAVKKVCVLMISGSYHLWYLPMHLGLVLMAPFLWKIVNGDKGKQWTELLLVLFFLFHIVPNTVNDFEFPYKEYIIHLMSLVQVNFVTGYVGFFVLGHYLTKYTLSRAMEATVYAIGILSAGYSIYLCQYVSAQTGTATQVFYENFTFAALFMSVSVFVFFANRISKITWKQTLERIITILGSHTFGIYLIHAFVLALFKAAEIDSLSFYPLLSIPTIALACFIISFVLAALAKKIPIIGKWIV